MKMTKRRKIEVFCLLLITHALTALCGWATGVEQMHSYLQQALNK